MPNLTIRKFTCCKKIEKSIVLDSFSNSKFMYKLLFAITLSQKNKTNQKYIKNNRKKKKQRPEKTVKTNKKEEEAKCKKKKLF